MTERRSPRRVRESAVTYTTSINERDLKQITRRIVRAAHPEMIILFGSRAYGTPRPDSDLDLMVVMDKEGSHTERIRPLKKLFPHLPVSLDLHARTPNEVTQRLEMGDQFMQTVVGQGKKLYPLRAKNGFPHRVRASLERGITQPMSNAPLVQEWVEKAEGDFEGAKMWSRCKSNLRPEKLCWDCEQCVETYLKAFLTRHRIAFERTHKLEELHTLCVTTDSDFRLIKSAVDKADICDPKIRYPGKSVTEQDAREALVAAKTIRKFVRAKLGLR